MKNNLLTECEIVPTDLQINTAINTAKKLMNKKIDKWILEQISTAQLKILIDQFNEELDRRGDKLK